MSVNVNVGQVSSHTTISINVDVGALVFAAFAMSALFLKPERNDKPAERPRIDVGARRIEVAAERSEAAAERVERASNRIERDVDATIAELCARVNAN